jgi:O-antigen/teichoic acid export membrane protein
MAVTLRARMRQLSTQSLVYGLSGALTKVVGLIIVPLLLRIFTPADFGVIGLISAFTSILGAVLILGSDAAVGYYYFREGDEPGRRALLSTWFIFQFALNSVAGLALFVFAHPLTQLVLGAAQNDVYLRLTGAVFPLGSTFAYALEVLRLQMRPARYLAVSAVNVLSGLVLTLILVVALGLGLTGVYVASAMTNLVAFAAVAVSLRGSFRLRFSTPRLRALLSFGVPLVPITLAAWAIGTSNQFFIKAHTGVADVGLFSAGSKVAQIMFLAVTAFSLAWGPFAFSIAEEEDAPRTYARVLTFYVAVLGWLALALSLFAPLILEIARPSFFRAYQVVPPLALSYMVYGAYPIVAIGTSLSRKTIHLSWTTLVGAGVTIAGNALLVPLPYLALIGGALATLGGNLVLVGLVYWVSQRLYPIPYEPRKVGTCIAILGILVLAGQVERAHFGPTSPAGLAFRAVLVASYPVLLVICGVLQRYELVVLRNALWLRAAARWRPRDSANNLS